MTTEENKERIQKVSDTAGKTKIKINYVFIKF